MNRDAALADLELARREWEAAFARVPDGALTWLKPGDDYSLGGLQIHVNWVLGHYHRVLDAMIASGFAAVGPQDPPGYEDAALKGARQGISAEDRSKSVDAMGFAHARVMRALTGTKSDDWTHKAPVVYRDGEEPYPTSPEDIAGWLADHYREHVGQCAQLIEEWRAVTAGG